MLVKCVEVVKTVVFWKMFFPQTAQSLEYKCARGFHVTWLVQGSVFVLPSAIAWHAHPPTCEVFLECIKLKCTCTNALATFCVTVRQLCCYVSKGQAVWFGLAWLAFQQCVRMLHVATRFCCAVHNNIIFVQQQEQTYCTSLRLIHSYQVSAYQTKLYKMSMYCH